MDVAIKNLPQHVAIIMDGNRRWARLRDLPTLEGHRAGTENIRRVIETFAGYDIKYLTLYAFSTENWARPKEEVDGLLDILSGVVDREAAELHKRGVRLRHLGKLDILAPRLQEAVGRALELTKDNQGIIVNVAFNYGGRAEIADAVRRLMRDGVNPEAVDETIIGQYLYTNGLPDPDLIIRTGGEMRLSNFLIWQAAYSEYYSTDTLWPDFSKEDIGKALLAYSQRQRRFGGR